MNTSRIKLFCGNSSWKVICINQNLTVTYNPCIIPRKLIEIYKLYDVLM